MIGTENFGAYARKMLIDGYIIVVDYTEQKKLAAEINSKLEHSLISMLDESEIAYRRNGGERRLPGLVSLSFPGKDGEAILHRMDLMGISISTGSACDSVNTEISHVLQAIMLDEKHSKGTVRISLGKNNTEAEAERIAEALIRIIV